MESSYIPLVGSLFCSECNSFLSKKRISSIQELGESKISTRNGQRTLQRYEEIYKCCKCGKKYIKIRYK